MKEDCCGMFRALSVSTRIRILEILKAKGPLGAKALAGLIGVTPAAVSQHLKVLRGAGLVCSERKGYFIPYRVDPLGLSKCSHKIVAVCKCEPAEGQAVGEWRGRPTGKRLRGAELADLEGYKHDLERRLDLVNRRLEQMKGSGGSRKSGETKGGTETKGSGRR